MDTRLHALLLIVFLVSAEVSGDINLVPKETAAKDEGTKAKEEPAFPVLAAAAMLVAVLVYFRFAAHSRKAGLRSHL